MKKAPTRSLLPRRMLGSLIPACLLSFTKNLITEDRERIRRGLSVVGPTARPEIPVRLHEAVGARELFEVDHGHVVGSRSRTGRGERASADYTEWCSSGRGCRGGTFGECKGVAYEAGVALYERDGDGAPRVLQRVHFGHRTIDVRTCSIVNSDAVRAGPLHVTQPHRERARGSDPRSRVRRKNGERRPGQAAGGSAEAGQATLGNEIFAFSAGPFLTPRKAGSQGREELFTRDRTNRQLHT